jgi:hypothetical protein
MAVEYFPNNSGIGLAVWKYSLHGVFHSVEFLESSVQGTNTGTAGTDERLVDIKQKQLHARIVLRVHGIFYRGG